MRVFAELQARVRLLGREFDKIEVGRGTAILDLAQRLAYELQSDSKVGLAFICSHNSRRSQFAQVWADLACQLHGLNDLIVDSGGTEATAVHKNAIAALGRCGFRITQSDQGSNPRYTVDCGMGLTAIELHSKTIEQIGVRKTGYCAVMTCSNADSECPVVPGATFRNSLNYDDPRLADGTFHEQKTYDSCCTIIGREMFLLIQTVAERLREIG